MTLRLGTRLRILTLITLTSLALMAVVDLLSVLRTRRNLTSIERAYLPLMELGPAVRADFENLRRSLLDAVSSQDVEALRATSSLRDALHERLRNPPPIVDRKRVDDLVVALDTWYALAIDVSSRLIAQETGEQVIRRIEEMQERQREVEELIEETMVFDRSRLEDAFVMMRREQDLSAAFRMTIRLLLGVVISMLTLGIARQIVRAVRELSAGFARFGKGQFTTPVEVPGNDELATVGAQANVMAGELLALGESLRARQAELERANRELEAFSYSVSHDLRAPLRSVDGFSQALLEDYGDQLPPEALDYLHRVRHAAQRMSQLIDDLLKLSRLSRAPMQDEDVDVSALAGEVADGLVRSAPERQVTFDIAPGLHARGDPSLLRVVLENLLGNAFKFTSKVPHARIEVGSRVTKDGETEIYVRDNGAGFDPRYASRLFVPFQRLHSASEFQGTGIGLATVQRVVHRHGGRIRAESQPGEGATFFFTLGDSSEARLPRENGDT